MATCSVCGTTGIIEAALYCSDACSDEAERRKCHHGRRLGETCLSCEIDALRARAEKAEAEMAALRETLEAVIEDHGAVLDALEALKEPTS